MSANERPSPGSATPTITENFGSWRLSHLRREDIRIRGFCSNAGLSGDEFPTRIWFHSWNGGGGDHCPSDVHKVSGLVTRVFVHTCCRLGTWCATHEIFETEPEARCRIRLSRRRAGEGRALSGLFPALKIDTVYDDRKATSRVTRFAKVIIPAVIKSVPEYPFRSHGKSQFGVAIDTRVRRRARRFDDRTREIGRQTVSISELISHRRARRICF